MLTYLLQLIRSKPMQEWSRRKVLSSLHDRETNNSVESTKKKKGILLWLQEWYQHSVIQTPCVPLNVLTARSEWVSHYGGYDTRHRTGRHDGLRVPEPTSQKASNRAWKLLDNSPENLPLQSLLRTLMHAKDAEYGMVTLHAWLCDLIVSKGYSHHSRLLEEHIQLQFAMEAYATDAARYVSMLFVLVLNVGSLYYIALKGAYQGYDWQVRFLSVCLLNWISETWFLRVWDIWMLDFYLPSWVLGTIEDTVGVIIGIFSQDAMLHHSAMTSVSNGGCHDQVSYQVALLRPTILESKAVLASVPCQTGSTNDDEEEWCDRRGPSKGEVDRSAMPTWVAMLSQREYWQQYLLVRIVASGILASLVYV
jgi:hypothetical protein